MMMKIFILTVLVALASQSTITLPFRNPLKDRSFSIAYNLPENKHINGVEVSFTSSGISFRGCNSNQASYELKFLGEFSITSKWGSTKRACQIDYDSEIIKLFVDTTQVHQLKSGRVNFYKGTQILLILRPIQIQPFNQLAGRSLLIQSTSLEIDAIIGIEVSFTDNAVSFKGCNTNSASYSVQQNEQFSIDSLWAGTLLICLVDFDSSITHLFSSSFRYALRLDGGVTFFNQKDVLIQLRPKARIRSLPFSPLAGKKFVITQTSLKNEGIIGLGIVFTTKIVSFQGCNTNSAAYSSTSENQFSVDQWSSSQKYCQVDYDSSVRQLFTNSKSYKIDQDGSISFYDAKSEFTLKLRLKPANIVPKGSYKIKSNWLNIQSINGVIVNFNNGAISFKQCNINFSKYEIYGRRQFKITSGWISTLVFCQNDNDKQIQSFFNNAAYFIPKGNEITFVDQTGKSLVILA